MASYDFVSPGSEAQNAIEKFLMQRALQERQQMEDQLRREQAEAQTKRADEQLKLQQSQEARVAAAQAQSQQDLGTEREFRRATTIVDNSMPSDQVDAATADMLTRQGYGGAMQRTQPTQGAHLGVDENSVDQYAVTPGVIQMRGGSRYLNAQAQREASSANAAAAQQATAERAREAQAAAAERSRESNEMRAQLGSGMGAIREETAMLRNDALRKENEQRDAKIEEEKKWREKTGEDAKRVTQNAYELATRLETHPGRAKSQGAYEMRGFTQDAQDYRGIRAQLVAALALPNLGALKGPMSDKDIVFIKNLATRLENDKLSDDEALLAIQEAKRFLESKGAATTTAGARPSAADLIRKYGGQ